MEQIHIQFVTPHFAADQSFTHQACWAQTGTRQAHQGSEWRTWPGARWGVPVGWRQSPACREMARLDDPSAEGHALLKLGLGHASTWETACVLFPTDGSAPATGGRRQKTEWRRRRGGVEWGEQPVVFPSFSSSLYDLNIFIYPFPLPGDPNVANLVFICLMTLVWYCICQHFRAELAHSSTVVKCAVI